MEAVQALQGGRVALQRTYRACAAAWMSPNRFIKQTVACGHGSAAAPSGTRSFLPPNKHTPRARLADGGTHYTRVATPAYGL